MIDIENKKNKTIITGKSGTILKQWMMTNYGNGFKLTNKNVNYSTIELTQRCSIEVFVRTIQNYNIDKNNCITV